LQVALTAVLAPTGPSTATITTAISYSRKCGSGVASPLTPRTTIPTIAVGDARQNCLRITLTSTASFVPKLRLSTLNTCTSVAKGRVTAIASAWLAADHVRSLNLRTSSFDTCLTSSFLPLHLRQLTSCTAIHLRHLLSLHLGTLTLLALHLRHLSTFELWSLCLHLPTLKLRPLHLLTLHLRHLAAFNLRTLCLHLPTLELRPLHLRSLHLGHLALHLGHLALHLRPLCLLPHLRLRPLHLRHLTLRCLRTSHLRLPASASAVASTATFALTLS
jgi:hypothetical protein